MVIIIYQLSVLVKANRESSKPTIVIANTIKGKGVSFMENDNNWHYRIPSNTEVKLAEKELKI